MNDHDSLAGEVRALEAQVQYLERESRRLRLTLWDDYFCAAMTIMIRYYAFADVAAVAAAAAELADEMLKIREARS